MFILVDFREFKGDRMVGFNGIRSFAVAVLISVIIFFGCTTSSLAGKACLYLTQAGGGDNGELYLINGTWQPFSIANRDVEKWTGVLDQLSDVGCDVVILDMTNLGQVRIMENALQATNHLAGMKFANFVTSKSHADQRDMTIVELANLQARDTWEMMAQDPSVYEYWGDKPLLILWASEEAYDRVYADSPPEHKTYLDRFKLGFAEAANNNTISLFDKDSFGYRSVSGHARVRQCAPCFGYNSPIWVRKTKEEYRKDCEWVKKATDYSVYGSWTHSDNMMMGIAQTENTIAEINTYPDTTDPYYYWDVLRSVLKGIPVNKTISLNVLDNGNYVRADESKDPINRPLYANQSAVGDLETFKVLDAAETGTENISLYNEYLGAYVRSANENLLDCAGTDAGGPNRFTWLPDGNGFVTLRSAAIGGQYVQVLNGTNQLAATQSDSNALYTAFACDIIETDTFSTLEHASARHLALSPAGNDAHTQEAGFETMDSQWVRVDVDGTWFYLENRTSKALLHNHSGTNVNSIAGGALPGSSAIQNRAQWTLVDAGGGWFRLQNKKNGTWVSENPAGGALQMVATTDTSNATLWKMVAPEIMGTYARHGGIAVADTGGGPEASLTWDSQAGEVFCIYQTDGLESNDWQIIRDNIEATQPGNETTIPLDGDAGFYSIRRKN